jgi:hypothetical protein
MDFSLSLLTLYTRLNHDQREANQNQMELNQRAKSSRSRRAIEKFDELLHHERAIKVEDKTA